MSDLNNSRPLDVHVWSEHPEINILVDELWARLFHNEECHSKRRGPKPKATKKKHVKCLLIDLYVGWKTDPEMYIAVHMSKSGWKANSRYNALNLSSMMIAVIHSLIDGGWLEHYIGFEGRLTRIRPSDKLRFLFSFIDVSRDEIDWHKNKEMLELRGSKDPAVGGSIQQLEYPDSKETEQMRYLLKRYNQLLVSQKIELSVTEDDYVERKITKGPQTGMVQRIYVDQGNLFVKRVFNNGSWKLGGRFYGGWWQQISKELRNEITINGKPTIEIDYKSMHVSLLFALIGHPHEYDPYSIELVDELVGRSLDQRSILKNLVLMCINSNSKKKAFSAFRSEYQPGHPCKRLKDIELERLLTAFLTKYPRLEKFMFSGKGLELMFLDSCIAEYVIKHFTDQNVPVLTLHDSFIIAYDRVLELRAVMTEAGNKYAGRHLFTDKSDHGLDEWYAEYLNTGVPPKYIPKGVSSL